MGGKGKRKASGARGTPQGAQRGGKKGQKGTAPFESTVVVKAKPSGRALPIPGLSNLGNTCFFNSVMQSLGQSHYFRARLERVLASPSYNMEIHLPGREKVRCLLCPIQSSGRQLSVVDGVGPLTSKLSSFLTQMQTSEGGCMNPRPVFSEICKKAPRFSSYHQQDSQELLRYLLDSLHSEEINRIKRAIITSFNITGNKKEQQAMITASDRADIKAYGLQAYSSQTFVYDVFGGVLISTVVCRECGNVSKMHETFLDLSLPVADDKSMDGPSSPVGYQSRNRTHRNTITHMAKSGQETGRAELSKHQIKKREKQARKATRTSQKKMYSHRTKISDEMVENDVSNQEASQVDGRLEEGAGEEASQVDGCLEEGAGEEASQVDGRLEEGAAEDAEETLPLIQDNNGKPAEPVNLDGDPAGGGVPQSVINRTPGEPQSASPTEEFKGQGTAIVQNRYAACGPLPDSSSNFKDLTENVAGLQIAKEGTSPATDNNVACEPLHEGGEAIGSSESSSQTVAATTSGSLAEVLKSVKVESLSLQFSLKKFCSVEILTGSNRFACVICTKLKTEKLLQASEQKENVVDLPEEEKKNHSSEEQEESKLFGSPRGIISLDDHHVDVCDVSTEDSSVSNKDRFRNSEEGDRESEVQFFNLEDSSKSDQPLTLTLQKEDSQSNEDRKSDNDDEEASSDEDGPKCNEKESSIAFCEATKQLLIEKAPPLLTLHLKRFIQIDRKLRKNNQHISFPMVLDISSLCVDSYKSDCDSEGRLLYSLYGVVEHSGSMHGGHYVGYVRTRTPPNIPLKPLINLTTKDLCPGTINNTVTECHRDSRQTQDSVSDQQTASTNNRAQSISSDDCVDRAKVTNSTLNFDLSSTKGQWYHVSDSHVRTATENEVVKSQAYLLFYERLPLVL